MEQVCKNCKSFAYLGNTSGSCLKRTYPTYSNAGVLVGSHGETVADTFSCEEFAPSYEAMMADKFLPSEDKVNHPSHYGGKDNPYETIKVIDAWGLDFYLGNSVKYISRAGKKDRSKEIEDLGKAIFYLNHKIELLKGGVV